MGTNVMDKLKESKEIEKIAGVIRAWESVGDINYRFSTHYATMLCEAGYHQASEIINEFAERIKKVIHERDYISGYAEIGLCEEVDEIVQEMKEEFEGKK